MNTQGVVSVNRGCSTTGNAVGNSLTGTGRTIFNVVCQGGNCNRLPEDTLYNMAVAEGFPRTTTVGPPPPTSTRLPQSNSCLQCSDCDVASLIESTKCPLSDILTCYTGLSSSRGAYAPFSWNMHRQENYQFAEDLTFLN